MKSKQKWRVAFNWLGKTHFVGYFTDEVEAALAYNAAAGSMCEGFAAANAIEGAATPGRARRPRTRPPSRPGVRQGIGRESSIIGRESR